MVEKSVVFNSSQLQSNWVLMLFGDNGENAYCWDSQFRRLMIASLDYKTALIIGLIMWWTSCEVISHNLRFSIWIGFRKQMFVKCYFKRDRMEFDRLRSSPMQAQSTGVRKSENSPTRQNTNIVQGTERFDADSTLIQIGICFLSNKNTRKKTEWWRGWKHSRYSPRRIGRDSRVNTNRYTNILTLQTKEAWSHFKWTITVSVTWIKLETWTGELYERPRRIHWG